MEAIPVSTGLVVLAELGDKTQIATVMLAARDDQKHCVGHFDLYSLLAPI